jgi:large subunit ribosomal protein L35
MPKMKTRKSAAKRYSVTGTGKVKRSRCGLRHKLEHKSTKVKNRAGGPALVHQAEHEKVRRMLPYAF